MNEGLAPRFQSGREPTPRARQTRRAGCLWEFGAVLVVAIVFTLVVRAFLVQAFFIPSTSMVPTLEVGDRILVSKLAYSLTDPERGEVVVFRHPSAPDPVAGSWWDALRDGLIDSIGLPTGEVEALIKRVIAIPGDRLEIRNDQVYVNGIAIAEPYISADPEMGDLSPIYIPEGYVWVMGDNRNYSRDSRVFGPVPISTISGKFFVRILPPLR